MKQSDGAGKAGVLKDAILIAGPTASGKSALALDVARRTGGTIVNADSMQVYSVLSVITARPDAETMREATHRLYGHVHPSEAYSTGHWLRDVEDLVAKAAFERAPAIFVGGTGLYFRALTEGISPMPVVPADVRERWRRRLADEGAQALHAVLAREDKQAASDIRAADGQRVVRALEVLEASGRSIRSWQEETTRSLVDAASARLVVIEPDRADLNGRIAARVDRMVEEGALDEVKALLDLDLPRSMPVVKAIGVREFGAVTKGETLLEDAIEATKTATRRYAKRQATWFRHQLGPDWLRVASTEAAEVVRG